MLWIPPALQSLKDSEQDLLIKCWCASQFARGEFREHCSNAQLERLDIEHAVREIRRRTTEAPRPPPGQFDPATAGHLTKGALQLISWQYDVHLVRIEKCLELTEKPEVKRQSWEAHDFEKVMDIGEVQLDVDEAENVPTDSFLMTEDPEADRGPPPADLDQLLSFGQLSLAEAQLFMSGDHFWEVMNEQVRQKDTSKDTEVPRTPSKRSAERQNESPPPHTPSKRTRRRLEDQPVEIVTDIEAERMAEPGVDEIVEISKDSEPFHDPAAARPLTPEVTGEPETSEHPLEVVKQPLNATEQPPSASEQPSETIAQPPQPAEYPAETAAASPARSAVSRRRRPVLIPDAALARRRKNVAVDILLTNNRTADLGRYSTDVKTLLFNMVTCWRGIPRTPCSDQLLRDYRLQLQTTASTECEFDTLLLQRSVEIPRAGRVQHDISDAPVQPQPPPQEPQVDHSGGDEQTILPDPVLEALPDMPVEPDLHVVPEPEVSIPVPPEPPLADDTAHESELHQAPPSLRRYWQGPASTKSSSSGSRNFPDFNTEFSETSARSELSRKWLLDKIHQKWTELKRKHKDGTTPPIHFDTIIPQREYSREEYVAVVQYLLELAVEKKVFVKQDHPYQPMWIYKFDDCSIQMSDA